MPASRLPSPDSPTPPAPVEPVRGLRSNEAAARLRRDGPNVLPRVKGPRAAAQFGRGLVHFFAVMLWVAAVLAALAGLLALSVAIVGVIFANAAFAFAQEYRAERAARRLHELLPRSSTVVRDGRRTVLAASDVVVDDLLVLMPGDRVPADARIVLCHGLGMDASLLTGESMPIHPDVGEDVHAGTFVTEGEGTALVTATGAGTRIAGIAALAQAGTRPPTPLTQDLRRLAHTIARVAVGVGSAFFAIGLLLGSSTTEGLVFAIGVTVAMVPEALLPTVTLTLAVGAQRMAARNALVRHLESVETLGSTTFVCTDKTGTLTLNRMTVVEVWTPAGTAQIAGDGYAPTGVVDVASEAGDALQEAARIGGRCANGRIVERDGAWVAQGDPMEAAVHALCARVGIDVDAEAEHDPVLARFAFDPRRRRTSIVTASRVLVTGAPDSVLPRCPDAPHDIATVLEQMTGQGQRVIAVADRARTASTLPGDANEAEDELRLRGLLGLEDPPRPQVAEALAACRRAGIRVAMVTGDHPATAMSVAVEVGLARAGGMQITGRDLPDDDDDLGYLLDRDGIVVARVTPEDKLRIARALQRRGHVVAMTGDGVNDGPALQQADIGVAMGASGTDVAREAADLVLLDDDFATIVEAIGQGRSTYENIRRFLTYHLTDNVAELAPFAVWALSGGRFPLALTVLQVLALDLGTDTLSAVALGAEPPRRDVLTGAPSRTPLLDPLVARRAFGILGPVEALFGLGAFVVSMTAAGWQVGTPFLGGAPLLVASGATFLTVALAQTANVFACRSAVEVPARVGWWSNRLLLSAVVIELAATTVFLFVPAVARTLRHAPPSAAGWGVAITAMVAVLVADAADKRWRRRARHGGRHG